MSKLGTVLYSILGALQVHHKGWSWSTVEWNPNLDAEAMERGLNPDHLFCRCCLNVGGVSNGRLPKRVSKAAPPTLPN